MLSELCRACGLCCDGSLFNHVKLDPGEAERLQALGVATRNGRLAQCCSALDGKDCRVYAARPGACARYVCALGEALERGDVPPADAHAVVDEAHRLIAALAALLPPPTSGIAGVMQRARAGQDGPISVEGHQAWLRVEAHLRQHFLSGPSLGHGPAPR